jgi:type I restriction enzyme R subunit
LVKKLAELRLEAVTGRQQGEAGMGKEATAFYEYIAQIGFIDGHVPEENKTALKALMETTVLILRETLGSIDFWQNPDKQKRVRGLLKNEIAKSGLEALKTNRERVAVEIMKLARNRHDELIKPQAAPCQGTE